MNEQEQISQLSALFDGELPPSQAQMVIRRVLKDPALRAGWERYALIGACLRDEPLAGRTSVADRVQASLAAEPESNVVALPARTSTPQAASDSRSALFGRGALGGAIAAGVALVAILLVRNIAPAPTAAGALVAGGAVALEAGFEESVPDGYTMPLVNAPALPRVVDASLGYYLVAHSEEAASALRFNYAVVQGGVELTEEEISALR